MSFIVHLHCFLLQAADVQSETSGTFRSFIFAEHFHFFAFFFPVVNILNRNVHVNFATCLASLVSPASSTFFFFFFSKYRIFKVKYHATENDLKEFTVDMFRSFPRDVVVYLRMSHFCFYPSKVVFQSLIFLFLSHSLFFKLCVVTMICFRKAPLNKVKFISQFLYKYITTRTCFLDHVRSQGFIQQLLQNYAFDVHCDQTLDWIMVGFWLCRQRGCAICISTWYYFIPLIVMPKQNWWFQWDTDKTVIARFHLAFSFLSKSCVNKNDF